MTDRLAREEAARKQDQGDERSAYLLLKHGANGRVAIPLSLVARLEEIPCSAIEHSGGREVVQYRSQIIPLVRLSQALNHRGYDEAEESDPMQVVVYSQKGQSVGLVVDDHPRHRRGRDPDAPRSHRARPDRLGRDPATGHRRGRCSRPDPNGRSAIW